MRILLLALILLWLPANSYGALSIPSNLSDANQQSLLQELGFATSFKPVDNPHPLGLYSGVEASLSVHDIPTSDIGYMGSGASVQGTLIYPSFGIGKGILENLDLFFNFTPYVQSSNIGIYSGGFRWDFFQATFAPSSFSFLFSAASTNVNNLFFSQTEGADLICGINSDIFSFFIGAGTYYGQGQFDPSVTVELAQTNIVARSFHTILGAAMNIGPAFGAMELDNYSTTVFSLRFGARL